MDIDKCKKEARIAIDGEEIERVSNFGGRGSSVGRARDSWSGGPGFDPRCGRPHPTGWVGVSIM